MTGPTTTRRLLVALALACYAAAFATTASAVRSSPGAEPLVRATPSVAPSPVAIVTPDGDPFAARVADATPAPAAARSRPERAPETLHVTAIVLGDRPQALVADGRSMRVVEPGDRLENASVDTIDDDGIGLSDGRRLPFAGAAR